MRRRKHKDSSGVTMLTGSAYLPAALHPSPRPRLMNETCSPCYRSPEDISGLLSIDLFTPSASRLHPLPLLQRALKFQSLLDFPFTFSSRSQLQPPPQIDGSPSEPLSPRAETGTKNSVSHGKESSHVKCDSQWQACLGPQGSQRHPSPCCPAVSHIRNSVASLGKYVASVELGATTTEGSLLEGGSKAGHEGV